jgi:hypothetical protein
MNELIAKGADGQTVLILVLEPGNINLLREGRPIDKRIHDYFPDGIPRKLELVIHYSETPLADSKAFAKMSKMTFDERSSKKVRPHCPECKSTIEQLGVWRNESRMALTFCSQCGCIFGMVPTEVANALSLPKPE